jgi:hypothetical protein
MDEKDHWQARSRLSRGGEGVRWVRVTREVRQAPTTENP